MKPPALLQAPLENGRVLLWPPEYSFPSLLEANRQRFTQARAEIQGKPLSHWRALARREILQLASACMSDETTLKQPSADTPLLLAGHQPELFHPGVWIKNFALNHLAQKHQMLPLNLVVDNDVPKSAALKVPMVGGEALPSITRIPFAQAASESPYEDWALADQSLFHELPQQALKLCDSWKEHPILEEFWAEAGKYLKDDPHPGVAFARARRFQERKWGVNNWELPISLLSGAESFHLFVFHLLENAETFLHQHNQAVVEYRHRHSLRSRNHPFVELAYGQGWVETPFWILHSKSPRRERLGVKVDADGEMRLGTPGPAGIRIPLGKADPFAALRSLPAQGFRIRPRAITTTLFARLFLAESFLHGIGGGKYDEVTDQLCESFFGCPPPDYLVVSATLRLNLLDRLLSAKDVEGAHLLWRDSLWNPQRHAPTPLPGGWEKLVEQKQQLLALPGLTRQDRQSRFHKLRQNLEALQTASGEQVEKLLSEAQRKQKVFEAQQAVQSREFSFTLFSQERLLELFRPFLSQ